MQLVIDGIVFQNQSVGGISRIFREVLVLMCSLDEELQILILTSGRLRQPIPTHTQILHVRLLPINDILRPRGLWSGIHNQLKGWLISREFGTGNDSIWLSTYYTMPPPSWTGKTVIFVYDMIHEKYANLFNTPANAAFRKQKRQAILSADQVICISQTTRRDLLDLYGIPGKNVIVAQLAHSSTFGQVTEEKQSLFTKPFILYTGRRDHYKNFHLFFEAYASWSNCYDIDLVLVGPPWTKPEKKLLHKHTISNQVHLLSNISEKLLNTLYNTAVAFVYPSLYEGFGIPLLEAMACGCPVVASDIPSSREVLADYAYYFDPTSIESLQMALTMAVQHGKDAILVNHALERAKQFDWHKTAQIVLEALKEETT